MPRYIDADALKQRIKNNWYTATEIDEDIDAEPTADVVERKVGKWVYPAADNVYRCSVCEEYATLEAPRLFYHYCPNCGAEMKGEDDE